MSLISVRRPRSVSTLKKRIRWHSHRLYRLETALSDITDINARDYILIRIESARQLVATSA